ncbi:DNA repair and recombination protein RadB [archaeon]|jgi:DNA repair protein RadB|nr:DNA repair and recombination protein RadB [archaeon]MBT6761681.1 DNA repair and recombination protein RadB [archaeon]
MAEESGAASINGLKEAIKCSTGNQDLNYYMGGGYEAGIITTIFGPSGSGKTNLALLAAVRMAETGKKVLIIDTEGGIAAERITQMLQNDLMKTEVLSRLLFFQPLSFKDQEMVFHRFSDINWDEIGMVVVDSISMLYRLELGRADAIFETNNSLGRQIASAVELARRRKIPVIMTNQVYSDFGKSDGVKMVGGDLLKYGSKCLIELQKGEGVRALLLRKHRSLMRENEFVFKIVGKGIEKVDVGASAVSEDAFASSDAKDLFGL